MRRSHFSNAATIKVAMKCADDSSAVYGWDNDTIDVLELNKGGEALLKK